MFKKEHKNNYTDLLGKTNRIVEGTRIEGSIQSKADFRLDGILIGDFTTDGKIVIGPSGAVTGNIICRNADIEGRYEGVIRVSELLTVKSTSYIDGEVYCSKLSVEPGAIFMATCVMKNANSENTDEKLSE